MNDDRRYEPPASVDPPTPDPTALAPDDDAVLRQDLAIFAHELRGALTVIAGYSDMLRRPLHDTERLAALDGIRRAVNRADALCSEVLSAKPMGAEQRAATGRAIAVEAPEDLAVAGNEPALARVLANLVANAVKYSAPDQDVLVSISQTTSSDLGDTAIIEVSDRGPGIPAEQRIRLLEPFQRLERDASVPGTGLGLSIVNDVVAAHGGRVEIRDRDGGGTTVRIELPLLSLPA